MSSKDSNKEIISTRPTYLQMLAIQVEQQQTDLRRIQAVLIAGSEHWKLLQDIILANRRYLEELRLAQMFAGTTIHEAEQSL